MRKILALIHIIFSVINYAQDTSNVNFEKNIQINILNENTEQNLDKNPLIKIRPLRIWDMNFNNQNRKISELNSSFNFKLEKESFVESDLFYIVVGSAVAFGTAAAYLKTESDKNYEKYKLTGNRNYLNKTNNLDVYSSVALGALQINFGYLIYRFLTD